jgi:hypothetical protein
MFIFNLPSAERHPAVWAAVHRRADLANLVSPENEFLAKAGDPHQVISNLVGFQYNIPLIANHCSILLVLLARKANRRGRLAAFLWKSLTLVRGART